MELLYRHEIGGRCTVDGDIRTPALVRPLSDLEASRGQLGCQNLLISWRGGSADEDVVVLPCDYRADCIPGRRELADLDEEVLWT